MEHGVPSYIPPQVAPIVTAPPAPVHVTMQAAPMPMPVSKPIHYEQISLTENIHLNAYPAPHPHPHPHPHHHYHHPVCVRPVFTTSGVILVLFILLVIVSRSGLLLPRK